MSVKGGLNLGYIDYLGKGQGDMRGLRLRYSDCSYLNKFWEPVAGSNYSTIVLSGVVSNAFQGEVEVFGDGSSLSLYKSNAIAIQGDVFIHHGGVVSFWLGGNQIADSSTVRMAKGTVQLDGAIGDLSERFYKIEVWEDSCINFSLYGSGYRSLFLDDLEIKNNAELILTNWRLNADRLLVRKDSEHLEEALRKIKFRDQSEPSASIREYDESYWEIIPGFPEPATYGAVFGAVGLGVMGYRRSRRRREATQAWRGYRVPLF